MTNKEPPLWERRGDGIRLSGGRGAVQPCDADRAGAGVAEL